MRKACGDSAPSHIREVQSFATYNCSSRHLSRLIFAAAIIATGLLTAFCATALGEISHKYTTSFGAEASTPSNPYPLSEPTAVAVDNSNGPSAGDFYVTDTGHWRVEKFTAGGALILMFGKEVNETADNSPGSTEVEKDVCTVSSGDTCKTGVPGDGDPGGFVRPEYIAVDGSTGPSGGDVYVGDVGGEGISGSVSKYSPSGGLIRTWGVAGEISGFSRLFGVAVDPNGSVFVLSNYVSWYNQDGSLRSTFEGPRSTEEHGVAVDAEDNLYKVDGSGGIIKFSDTGGNEEELESGIDAFGEVVDPSTNDLYVANRHQIFHYARGCGVQCAPLDSFGEGDLSFAQGISINASSGAVYVADTLREEVVVFEDVLPVAITGSSSEIGLTSATVSGQADPAGRGDITECTFEYGITTSYGKSAPCSSQLPFASSTAVSAELTGLASSTKYHYRLVVANANGESDGSDQTFRTAGAPGIVGINSSEVGETSAQLEADINPRSAETSCYFEYGATIRYGSVVACPNGGHIPASQIAETVKVNIDGLNPGDRYHFRVVATNTYGTAESEDDTFSYQVPNCPNQLARQQTRSSLLPECRAYELVSASDAGATTLVGGWLQFPNADEAFGYLAAGGIIPGSGEPQNDLIDDFYVAPRGPEGWSTHYVGIPGNEYAGREAEAEVSNEKMDRFLVFNSSVSDAPYLYSASGKLWPAGLLI